jgi:hypothetical protein
VGFTGDVGVRRNSIWAREPEQREEGGRGRNIRNPHLLVVLIFYVAMISALQSSKKLPLRISAFDCGRCSEPEKCHQNLRPTDQQSNIYYVSITTAYLKLILASCAYTLLGFCYGRSPHECCFSPIAETFLAGAWIFNWFIMPGRVYKPLLRLKKKSNQDLEQVPFEVIGRLMGKCETYTIWRGDPHYWLIFLWSYWRDAAYASINGTRTVPKNKGDSSPSHPLRCTRIFRMAERAA